MAPKLGVQNQLFNIITLLHLNLLDKNWLLTPTVRLNNWPICCIVAHWFSKKSLLIKLVILCALWQFILTWTDIKNIVFRAVLWNLTSVQATKKKRNLEMLLLSNPWKLNIGRVWRSIRAWRHCSEIWNYEIISLKFRPPGWHSFLKYERHFRARASSYFVQPQDQFSKEDIFRTFLIQSLSFLPTHLIWGLDFFQFLIVFVSTKYGH